MNSIISIFYLDRSKHAFPQFVGKIKLYVLTFVGKIEKKETGATATVEWD